jgi:hypothetical protein
MFVFTICSEKRNIEEIHFERKKNYFMVNMNEYEHMGYA